MFTTPAPAAPTISTNTSSASPSSPTRASRLRGLQYLRSYTHGHLHSHSNNSSPPPPPSTLPPAPRAQSTPVDSRLTADLPGGGGVSDTTTTIHLTTPEASSIQRSSNPGSTGGWLPSVGFRGSLTGSSRENITVSQTRPDQSASTPSTTAASMRTMTRNRAETAAPVLPSGRAPPTPQTGQRTISAPDIHVHDPAAPRSSSTPNLHLPTIRFIPHHDSRTSRPSLEFPAISRTIPSQSTIIRVGRYSERDSTSGYQNEPPPGVPSSAPVGFKSKVVSRRHCEFWCNNSQWYIKDVGSSSGTFLNHIRLSQPGVESKPFKVNDSDVVQLGIDFRGGEEMIFRCVKIRVECNRGWQKALNNFNKSTHKRLRNLRKTQPKTDGDAASTHSLECSICLMSVAPCQSLFIAPCSHVWHYKCIRPILNGTTWPNFLCPNCRAVVDLEADIEDDDIDWSEDDDAEEDPEIKRAIEESLKQGSGARTNGEGDVMLSLDVTEAPLAENGTIGISPDADTGTMAGATLIGAARRTNSGAGRQISEQSYGPGGDDQLRSPRPQRSFKSATSPTSSRQTREQPRDGAENAELAALVAGMNFPGPVHAPTAPSGLRKPNDDRMDASGAVPIPGTAGVQRRAVNINGRVLDGDSDDIEDGEATVMPGALNRMINRVGTPNAGPGSAQRSGGAAEIGGPDCPMTPRNDAGPFILDGSGGR